MDDLRSQLVTLIYSVPARDTSQIAAITLPEAQYLEMVRHAEDACQWQPLYTRLSDLPANLRDYKLKHGALCFHGVLLERGNISEPEVRYRTVGLLV